MECTPSHHSCMKNTGLQDKNNVTHILDLPSRVLIRIFAFVSEPSHTQHGLHGSASMPASTSGLSFRTSEGSRTVLPLVCKRFNEVVRSEQAKEVLYRSCAITERSLPQTGGFGTFERFWTQRAQHMQELDASITAASEYNPMLHDASISLTHILAAAFNLQVLRISGMLEIGSIFESLRPHLHEYHQLTTVMVAGWNTTTWAVQKCISALPALPALHTLQIDFSSDIEDVDPCTLNDLQQLTSLKHLALTYPLRSALPPVGSLPDGMSNLTGLTALKLRRVPLQDPDPSWLGHLTNLQHLLWDPYLSVDLVGSIPACLSVLTGLVTLILEVKVPYTLPTTLTNLERLLLMGRVDSNKQAVNDWEWLRSMPKLTGLRLQGAGLTSLPPAVTNLSLTRLSLNCNRLVSDGFPPGTWLSNLQYLYLGGNMIHSFPTVLRQATSLKALHLANQTTGAHCATDDDDDGYISFSRKISPVNLPQRLNMTGDDVAALLALSNLKTVVMNMGQPQVHVGSRLRDFDWLQQVLRRRQGAHGGIKLTSDELLYHMQDLSVFDSKRLELDVTRPLDVEEEREAERRAQEIKAYQNKVLFES